MGFNINITGIKSLDKFIGLADTPIYYEDGKFFKVKDNHIVYTDIEWSDISGEIANSEHFEVIISSIKDDIINKEHLVNKKELQIELDKKQPIGDYATKIEVAQLIASIPQFKTKVVSELPDVGEKMVLYLVPKQENQNDIYNEYIWIEEARGFEFLGTMALDLSEYLTPNKLGISKVSDPMTQDDYDNLEVKEPNVLYLIEEQNAQA